MGDQVLQEKINDGKYYPEDFFIVSMEVEECYTADQRVASMIRSLQRFSEYMRRVAHEEKSQLHL